MVKLTRLFAIACGFFASVYGLDVHCDSDEPNGCHVKEQLDIQGPTKLNFVDADEWSHVIYFTIPSHNNVSVMPSGIFTRFPKLNQVRISTGLKSIKKDDFKNADALRSLELQVNHLQVIQSNVFSEAPNLEQIDLSSNHITSIEDFAFNGLNKLDSIFLQYNNLTTLKRNTFAGAEKLLAINLVNNPIASIEDGSFDLPNLQYLHLWENSIHSLSDNLFVGAPKLFAVSVAANGLTHIGQSFYKSNSLNSILLDVNKIEDIDLVSFGKMPELKTLTLKNSGFSLEKAPETQASTNSSVTNLDLADNGLSNSDVLNRLERMGYVNLETLNLEQNLFTDIKDIEHIKRKFPNITQLGLSDNKLTCEWIKNAVEILSLQSVYVISNSREVPSDVKNVKGTICV